MKGLQIGFANIYNNESTETHITHTHTHTHTNRPHTPLDTHTHTHTWFVIIEALIYNYIKNATPGPFSGMYVYVYMNICVCLCERNV